MKNKNSALFNTTDIINLQLEEERRMKRRERKEERKKGKKSGEKREITLSTCYKYKFEK
jgi:hypothetical protein